MDTHLHRRFSTLPTSTK